MLCGKSEVFKQSAIQNYKKINERELFYEKICSFFLLLFREITSILNVYIQVYTKLYT